MDDPRCVCRLYGSPDLADDDRCLFTRQRRIRLGIPLEELTTRPFDCEKMEPGVRLTDLDRFDNIGMHNAGSVLCFSNEARDSRAIMPQFFAENLEGDSAMAGVLSLVHCGSTTLANLTL